MNLFIPVLRLPDPTVRQRVPNMVRIRPKVLFVGRMSERLLEKKPVVELVVDLGLQVVQGEVEPEMADQDGKEKSMLNNICHQSCFIETLGRDDHGGVPLHFHVRPHLLESFLLAL